MGGEDGGWMGGEDGGWMGWEDMRVAEKKRGHSTLQHRYVVTAHTAPHLIKM